MADPTPANASDHNSAIAATARERHDATLAAATARKQRARETDMARSLQLQGPAAVDDNQSPDIHLIARDVIAFLRAPVTPPGAPLEPSACFHFTPSETTRNSASVVETIAPTPKRSRSWGNSKAENYWSTPCPSPSDPLACGYSAPRKEPAMLTRIEVLG